MLKGTAYRIVNLVSRVRILGLATKYKMGKS